MTRVRVTHVSVKEIMSRQLPVQKVKKVKEPPSIKEMTKGIDYSRKSEFQDMLGSGKREYLKAVKSGTLESFHSPSRDMLGSGKREYLKKGENPIKPNLSGKEYEGPTKKYEKKKTKKKGRKSLRKINQRLA